ncbi:MAG TPA: 1-deoxy-D-xylulose-5-phosphate reductoisomerase [Paenalcaligenes sp.]|nr:1-deoxy-D-xylulose-5-phosphate reductoisomerase [Paenalcaligenes sp.]
MDTQQVCILGATGSIGRSTLEVIALHPDRFSVYALTAFNNIDTLVRLAWESRAQVVVVPDQAAQRRFSSLWPTGRPVPEIRLGQEGLCETAADPAVDTVMAAIVGAACLPSVFAAAQAGKRILLANKEALVAAGAVFLDAVRSGGAQLLPIDSEHNAIYQCMPSELLGQVTDSPHPAVKQLILTASGGPFRTVPLESLASVTPEQACLHPNWIMGKKISVDSATMANKGLEVIEAHWLFGMPVEQISVVIHPQSVVHSMVEYVDGSVLSQMAAPDMRVPIAYGLGFPQRIHSGSTALDLAAQPALEFAEPCLKRFPALKLAFEALGTSQEACVALNAANEVAVDRFLQGKLGYIAIAQVVEQTIEQVVGESHDDLNTLDAVIALDGHARHLAQQFCIYK